MLLVIFGAGASHDSIDRNSVRSEDYVYRPPLANGLFVPTPVFGPLMDRFRYLPGIIPALRSYDSGSDSIENELRRIEEEAEGGSLLRTRQLMAARFYLREALWECSERWPTFVYGQTNYVALLDLLLAWQEDTHEEVVIVTFNYDTLLEQALVRFGATFAGLTDYLHNTGISIVKAHGSIDWCHWTEWEFRPTDGDIPNAVIERAKDLPIDPGFRYQPNRSLTGEQSRAFVPAVAIPITKDKHFECPPAHEQLLREAARTASRLLVVGWAGADAHMLRLLEDEHFMPKRGLIACGNHAGSIATRDRMGQVGMPCEPLNMGFTGLVTPANRNHLSQLLSGR